MKKKFTFLIAAFAALMLITLPGMVKGQTRDDVTGTINFGNASGSTNINSASVTGDDSQGNTWTITTTGTTSFTPNAAYAQIGSSNKPATSITFTTTLDASQSITAMSAKFGGFSGTAGTITLKVGDTSIGSGSLNATNDVTVSNSSTASGTVLTVTVTGISKGVKCYYISYTYSTGGGPTTYTVTYDCNGGTSDCPENATGIEENTKINLASAPSKTGHSFGGWDDGTTTYEAGAEYTVTGNVTMTAQWTANPYTITYKAGEGSGSDVVVNKNYGESYVIATNSFTAPAGKPNFRGWNTQANGTGTPYSPGQNITVSADLILFAQWSNSVTATYTVASKTTVTATGTIPTGSIATFDNNGTNANDQLTGGKRMILTLSGYQGQVIKGITLNMKSNSSSGSGYMSAVVGSTTIASVSDNTFNNWPGMTGYTSSYTDVVIPMSNALYNIKDNENIVITINATANSLYCKSFTIEYEASNSPSVSLAPTSRVVNYTAHNSNTENLNFTVSSENIDSPTYQLVYCDSNGSVLDYNPYSSWFTATLSGSEVSFTTNQNSGDEREAYFKVYAELNSEPVYSGLCSVTQGHETHTYTLVTSTDQLVSGKHYVIASSKTAGNAYAMGAQSGNVRDAIAVTITENGNVISIEETDNIREFVLSGTDSDNWTLYDKKNPGFLYASSSSSNNIGTRANNPDGDSQWEISFISTYNPDEALFMAQGTNDRKTIRYNYNSGSPRFSCYKTDSSIENYVYLYVLANDKSYEFYSNTTLGSATVANDEIYTIKKSVDYSPVLSVTGTLTVNGTLANNGTAANLIIEDGGQLICSNPVAATVKKNITNASAKAGEKWYAISSSVHDDGETFETIDNVTNLTSGTYDMFCYDEPSNTWLNQKPSTTPSAAGFSTMMRGRGYIYRNTADKELAFTGQTNFGTVEYGDGENYYLGWSCKEESLRGFNLVGNPYPHKIYKGVAFATTSGTTTDTLVTGYYALEGDGSWTAKTNSDAIDVNQAILVEATEYANGKNLQFKDRTNAPNAKSNNDNIMFTVENSAYSDIAYAWFDNGNGLKKIEHRNANIPMLYINQDGTDYAIAMMSDNTKSFGLNFKAKTMGTYTLSYKAEGNFDYLHVIDRLTGEDVDMLMDGKYSFVGSPQDNAGRFIVKLGYDNGSSTGSETFVYQNGNDIIVDGEGTLEVFDVTGRKVMTTDINGVETINGLNTGVYIFRVIGETLRTQKIVVR